MNIDQILDLLLVPRPNGSANLDAMGDTLHQLLAANGAQVTEQNFLATPHGFQLMWLFAMLLMSLYSWCLFTRRYAWALALPALLAVILFLEFEHQVSTVSMLWPATERNIIGTWPGQATAGTLVFTAHYDTTTHFGDHFSWGLWGQLQGPATGIALALPLLGLWLQRKQKHLPKPVMAIGCILATLPFAAMCWFQSIGPLVRTPSIGAIDNGGSMAALVMLAEKLKTRPANSGVTVKIVFLASEEERTLGSKAYAQQLHKEFSGKLGRIKVINLESIATTDKLAFVPEDGFATTRYRSSEKIISWLNQYSAATLGYTLEAKPLPFGTLTDGRSFLAEGIETMTLRSLETDEFPHHLHSEYDSRDRLSVAGIENATKLLNAIAEQAL